MTGSSLLILVADLLDKRILTLDMAFETPQCRAGPDILAPEDISLDPPRRNAEGLVRHELASGDSEDIIQFFL